MESKSKVALWWIQRSHGLRGHHHCRQAFWLEMPNLLLQEEPKALLPCLWLWGRLTVVLIFPFSVVMLSLWCRCAKGLAAPQDSKYRVMRTDALILAPSRVWRGLKRCWGLRRSPLGGETASWLVHSNLALPPWSSSSFTGPSQLLSLYIAKLN